MITEGKTVALITTHDDIDIDDKVSFRILSDYIPMSDTVVARIDVLTYKYGIPHKQFGCMFEIKEDIVCLPLQKGTIGGVSTLIPKETLINIFQGFIDKLKES